MNQHLSVTQIILLCGYAVGMAGGQMLFKLASLRLSAESTSVERVISLLHNFMFLGALVVYLGLSALWVSILKFVPLSQAYPFVALSFGIVPILSHFAFAEPVSGRLILGIIIVLFGLVLVAS